MDLFNNPHDVEERGDLVRWLRALGPGWGITERDGLKYLTYNGLEVLRGFDFDVYVRHGKVRVIHEDGSFQQFSFQQLGAGGRVPV